MNSGAKRQKQMLVSKAIRMRGVVGQSRKVLIDHAKLESNRTGIIFVGQQKVRDGMCFQLHEVPSAKWKGAFGDFQDRFEQRGVVPRRHNCFAQQLRDENNSLDPAAHVQKSPCLALHHRIDRESHKRRKRDDQAVQQLRPPGGGIVRVNLECRNSLGKIFENMPSVGSQAISKYFCQPMNLTDDVA